MPPAHTVSLLGLCEAEREFVIQCLQGAGRRTPCYAMSRLVNEARLIIADAGHEPSVQLVVATERLAATVFVGDSPPAGSVACISRPIDAEHLLRELDFLVAAPRGRAAAQLQAVAASRWKGESDRRRQGLPAGGLPAVAPVGPAPTALLVDDSEVALRFLETRLQRWGLVMDRALSSGRAVELLARRDYDFVFLDIQLGAASDLDGLALCQQIKRHRDGRTALSTSVFLVSAHASASDRVRATLAGSDAFLAKPLDEVELQRLLLRHGLQPQPQTQMAREAREAH